MVFYFQFSFDILYFYWAPHLLYGVVRAFTLKVWSYYSVCTKVTHAVYNAVLVGSHNTLIGQIPQETACTTWVGHHHLPVVFQSGTVSAII